jgi:tRNA pseudouridine55 synthase
MNGVLIIDKPCGLTSHDVVGRVRRILKQKAVGHLGTLDPLATGVLPLVLGNMTRLAQFYLASEKSYEGVIRFGFATDTYDAEGKPLGPAQESGLTLDELRALAAKFQGIIEQTPPPFSAKKVQGVPAYKLARKKKDVQLKPVQVEIKEFEITHFEDCRAHFRARVASGTYMRAIAHELGDLAGCGAHLESLRRTAVAEFQLADAHTLDEVECAAQGREVAGDVPPRENEVAAGRDACSSNVEALLVHPRKLLPAIPAVTANDEIASKIRHGRPVNLPELSRAHEVKVFHGQRDLIAISTRVAGTLFHPRIVLV